MKQPRLRWARWPATGLCLALMLSGCSGGSGYAVEKMDSSPSKAVYQPEDLDAAFAQSQLSFAFDLYRELQQHKSSPQANDTISPVSIATALAMTMNGAAGDTLVEMETALHSSGRTSEERNHGYEVLADLLSHSSENVQVSLANSLWGRTPLEFRKEFLDASKSYYNAEIESLDFSGDGAAKRINDWVNQQTAGKIDSIVDSSIPANTILYLINTVYFKGTWQREFEADRTMPADFTNASGEQQQVSMMHNGGSFPYVHMDGYQAIRLPYKDSGLGMVILLPDEELTLDELISDLEPERWQTMLDAMSYTVGHIGLPKFKLEFEQSLNSTLQALGMERAFDIDRAQFEPMIQLNVPVFIGEAKHKTFIEVDEKGTEAAAATVIEMEAGSAPPEDPFDMVVDRPFFFAIEDERTSALLFMGSVQHIPAT